MNEYNYQNILRMIDEGEFNPVDVWLEDENGIHWYWEEGNFFTGLKDMDREPPRIYLTDKYNLMQLYNIKFKIIPIEMSEPEILNINQIINKYGKGNCNIGLLNKTTSEMWEFVPLKQDILNRDGESITEYVDNDKLDMIKFEVLYKEKSLEKADIKDNLKDALDTEITTVANITHNIVKELADINDHLEHLERLYKLHNDLD